MAMPMGLKQKVSMGQMPFLSIKHRLLYCNFN